MIAILQPFIPHYRKDFFLGLKKDINADIYCYETRQKMTQLNFQNAGLGEKRIRYLKIGPFKLINPFPLLQKKYKVLVLMINPGHISSWFILLIKPLIRKKIILWGHGISVKQYLSQEKKLPFVLKQMVRMCDEVWFYTAKEKNIWLAQLPSIKAFALNNTITGVEEILKIKSLSKTELKQKFGITQQIILIFCARFNEVGRRVDLLIKMIETLPSENFGFIIIGDGALKPDFKNYKNVYNYGSVYDKRIKDNLFGIADIYYQPGWVGLSVVEAMAYGKPVFTFKRQQTIHQCVEYSYLINNYNAKLFKDFDVAVKKITSIKADELNMLGSNAKKFAIENLLMSKMVDNAVSSLQRMEK